MKRYIPSYKYNYIVLFHSQSLKSLFLAVCHLWALSENVCCPIIALRVCCNLFLINWNRCSFVWVHLWHMASIERVYSKKKKKKKAEKWSLISEPGLLFHLERRYNQIIQEEVRFRCLGRCWLLVAFYPEFLQTITGCRRVMCARFAMLYPPSDLNTAHRHIMREPLPVC